VANLVWLGNGTADRLQADADSAPIAVGEKIALTQEQVAALERQGHRFASPKDTAAIEAAQEGARQSSDVARTSVAG